MPREKINLNIDVSATVVQGREVKLPLLKCEAFADVKNDSQELEPVMGWIEIEVRDLKGMVINRGKHEMRSFVNNLIRVLEGIMKDAGGAITSTSVTDTGGVSRTAYVEWYSSVGNVRGGGTVMAGLAPDNDSSYGIIVGTGTTPVNLNQVSLASPIAHGTNVGQLDYDAESVEDLGLDTSVSPPVYRFRLIRGFKNLSGDSITINEVGLVARNYWKDNGGIRNDVKYLIARDVLPTSYTIPDGGSATVVVTIEVVLG